jgi:hypothetical protein
MARPDNRRDDCPAFLKPDRKALRTLKQLDERAELLQREPS